jgi:hypothetical protein
MTSGNEIGSQLGLKEDTPEKRRVIQEKIG